MRRDTWSSTQRSWSATGYPLTIWLMVITFVVMVVSVFAPGLVSWIDFNEIKDLAQPWRLLTYIFFPPMGLFDLLFRVGFLYWIFGSLERSWGTRIFALFVAAVAVIPVFCLVLGQLIVHTPIFCDPALPIAAGAVAWGLLNANERVCIWFIPMPGIAVSGLGVLLLFFDYGRISPVLIPLALSGCAFAYIWVTRRAWEFRGYAGTRKSSGWPARRQPKLRMVPQRKATPQDDRFSIRDLNPIEWIARKRRRAKFERLMKDD